LVVRVLSKLAIEVHVAGMLLNLSIIEDLTGLDLVARRIEIGV
jgi:hypothetical protein